MKEKIHLNASRCLIFLAVVLASFSWVRPALAIDAELDGILGKVMAAQVRLFENDVDKLGKELPPLIASLDGYVSRLGAGDPHRKQLETAAKFAKGMLAAGADLAKVRVAFQELSKSICYLMKEDQTIANDYQLWFCPMVKTGFGYWVQKKTEKMYNPHKGAGDHCAHCGVKRDWSKLP